jgi:hypothetical protein
MRFTNSALFSDKDCGTCSFPVGEKTPPRTESAAQGLNIEFIFGYGDSKLKGDAVGTIGEMSPGVDMNGVTAKFVGVQTGAG